jgi:hypothetical protein
MISGMTYRNIQDVTLLHEHTRYCLHAQKSVVNNRVSFLQCAVLSSCCVLFSCTSSDAQSLVNSLLVTTAAVMIDILCSHACCDDVYTIAGTGH